MRYLSLYNARVCGKFGCTWAWRVDRWKITGGAENFFGSISTSAILKGCHGQIAQSGGSDGSTGPGAGPGTVTAYTNNATGYAALLTALTDYTPATPPEFSFLSWAASTSTDPEPPLLTSSKRR